MSGDGARFRVVDTELPGVKEIVGPRFTDERGAFMELYREAELGSRGLDFSPVQANVSSSEAPGTVRGLHYQAPPHAQAKLVQVVQGAVYDVALDLRKDSPSHGRWVARELSAGAGNQLLVPRGFAHGFCTLEARTVVVYLLDAYYEPAAEGGIHWRSPELAIPWPELDSYVISEKDRTLPPFSELDSPFGSSEGTG